MRWDRRCRWCTRLVWPWQWGVWRDSQSRRWHDWLEHAECYDEQIWGPR
jgi:hypothetical protein